MADDKPLIRGLRKLQDVMLDYQILNIVWVRVTSERERACLMAANKWFPMYLDSFEAGLRFPLLGLIFDVLANYGLALTQLIPNLVKFLVGFMLLCAHLGILSKSVVFRAFFQC